MQIKWICPTAPTRPVAILGGFPCTACKFEVKRWHISRNIDNSFLKQLTLVLYFITGFDVGELSEDCPDDFEGLDASAAHIANLLSTEPADSKILYSYFIIMCELSFSKAYRDFRE